MSERRFGILIASSRFGEPNLQNLRCPENDVDGLNEILASIDHGEFTEIFVLKNKPHQDVLLKINQVLREADKNDLVLIYYSGHGKLNFANRLHLTTTNTVVSALEATSIPVSTLKEYVDISRSNKVVLILDCCFSGAVGDVFSRSGVDDQLQLASRGRGTYIMTASTGIQVAQEKESDQYGVFTKHIIEGIRSGEADLDSDGRVTMEELYRYVHDKVLDEGFQEPMKWDLSVRGELIIARSGKTPRERRNKQIRDMLFDLAKANLLPDDILDKARYVISLEPDQLSGDLKAYDALLDQLLNKRIGPVELAREWDKVHSEPSPIISEPRPPEPPSTKPAPTEPQPPKPEVPKPRPAKPKPPEIEPAAPEPSKPDKARGIWIAGAAIVIVALLLVGGLWYFNSHRRKMEVRSEVDQLSRQISSLEKQVKIARTSQRIETLQRENDSLIRQLKKLEDRAAAAGVEQEPAQLQARLSLMDRQLAALERQLVAAREPEEVKKQPEPVKTGRLFVESVPREARVKILNIKPRFEQGIQLEPGSYHVEVSAPNYQTQSRWIELGPGKDERISFELTRLEIPLQELFTNSIGMKFVSIPAGSFMMGSAMSPSKVAKSYGGISDWYIDEVPQHKVTISKPFYMQTTEVTQAQWTKVMGTVPGSSTVRGEEYPAYTSWYEAKEFIKKLNQIEGSNKYRLPTEAEWEYASRAGSATRFFFGDNVNLLGEYAWSSKNSVSSGAVGPIVKAHPVGQKKPNPWGLYDIYGNVYEWCQDWYAEDYYSKSPERDPQGSSNGKYRVYRGGCWNRKAGFTNSVARGQNLPNTGHYCLGLRVVRDF